MIISNEDRLLLTLYFRGLNYSENLDTIPYEATNGSLSEFLGIDRTNIPKNTRELLKENLIKRVSAPLSGAPPSKNKRSKYIGWMLTEKGGQYVVDFLDNNLRYIIYNNNSLANILLDNGFDPDNHNTAIQGLYDLGFLSNKAVDTESAVNLELIINNLDLEAKFNNSDTTGSPLWLQNMIKTYGTPSEVVITVKYLKGNKDEAL